MFGWLKKKRIAESEADSPVKVYLNPLVMLLHGAEQKKGSYLTEQEVLSIRESAAFVMMTPAQAAIFYRSLDSQVPVYRIDPNNVWEEWQAIRDHVE